MDIQELAQAFAAGRTSGSCHNATINEHGYWLHGNLIASLGGFSVMGDWCGYYTRTTASHLNAIAEACISKGMKRATPHKVSYAEARNSGTKQFNLVTIA